GVIQTCQIIEGCGSLGMVRASHFLFNSQRTLKERLGFCVPALGVIQLCQVIEGCSSSGMIRIKRFLFNSQRTLKERLGFCIPALVQIEQCQIIEGRGRAGMVKAKHFLPHSQRMLEEPFSLTIERAILEIGSSSIKQSCCLGRLQLVLLNEGGADERVCEQVIDGLPALSWKCCIHHLGCMLDPLTLLLLWYRVLEHRLY